MCTKLKKAAVLLAAFLCLFLLSGLSYAADTGSSSGVTPQTVVMSRTQYEKLKQITATQNAQLTLLETKLDLLASNSDAQAKALIESRDELATLKERLKTTDEKLANAEISLQQADDLLKKNEESLNQLTQQIKSMKRRHKLSLIRNVVKSVLVGFAVGYVVAK